MNESQGRPEAVWVARRLVPVRELVAPDGAGGRAPRGEGIHRGMRHFLYLVLIP